MDNESDVTREQMDATRASLSEKMDTLEHKVVDTMQGAANAVAQTVDNVKDVNDAVHDTVENVKDTFDLHLQMTRHPWALVGGSIALGYLGAYLLFRRGTAQLGPNGGSQPATPASPGITEKQNGIVKTPRVQEEEPTKEPVQDVAPAASHSGWLGAGMNRVKGLAIGMVLGVVRDTITESAPDLFKVGLADVIDGVTVQLGGEPFTARL